MKNPLLSCVEEKAIMSISEKINNITQIRKEINASQAYIFIVMKGLENNKIITRTKNGRKSIIELTEKGLKVQEHLNAIKNLI